MAVKRIEWTCPGCDRRFAIPADVPTPEVCPQCQAAAPSPPEPPQPPPQPPPRPVTPPPQPPTPQFQVAPQPPAPQFPPSGLADAGVPGPGVAGPQPGFDSAPAFQQQPAPAAKASGRSSRRRHAGSRSLAFCCKLLAFLLGVGAVVGIFVALGSLNQDVSEERNTKTIIGLSVFGGGLIVSLVLLAIGKVIDILLDIEEHTRQQ